MDKATTAWMLRRDGTAFPCQWHYYGSADPADVEETLYAAEWLYDATQSEETRQLCLDLMAAYGVALRPNRNLVRNLLLAIRERPYVFLSRAFVERHAGELFYVDPARLPRPMPPKPTPSLCCGIRRAPDTMNIWRTGPGAHWIISPCKRSCSDCIFFLPQ